MRAVDTITRIREALQSRRGDWPTICDRTGLSYWWLTKFAQGRIAEPGLSKIERLQADLAANPATDRRRSLSRREASHG